MSIAVSVPIVPSRLLRVFVSGFAAMLIAMGVGCAAGWLGPLLWPKACCGLCLTAGVAVLVSGNKAITHRRLDVLGVGTLALTVQQGVGPPRRFPVRLLAGSTLWPNLLVLRLSGAPPLVLMPDSVPPGEFRRLGMAFRAVAGRSGGAAETRQKIH